MRLLIIALMLIFAINALAAPATLSTSMASNDQRPFFKKPRSVRPVLAYGGEIRPEKDTNSDLTPRNMTNYAIGVVYNSWFAIFEKATFTETSGNATLNVKRDLEDLMLWGHYRSISWKYLAPYIGLGAGYYKDKVRTSLMGSPTENESKNKLLIGSNVGLSLEIPIVWLSVEARVLFGEDLDRQPTIGGLVRAGVSF